MLRLLLRLIAAASLALVARADTVSLEGRVFTLPSGYTAQKATTTNLVLRPVNACFDDQGRLYVTDSSGSSEAPADQAKDPKWRVVRLEDTDHDGVFDKQTVFADHLPMLQGILWHQGVVYIGGTPAIWKLIDKDGDGKADERVEWWNVGRPSTHCGNEVHGPYAGPDGFIYWTKGAFEPIAWTNGVTGQAHLDRGAHIFRARPDGSEMDSIMTGGMDNPVEVAFTRGGECLFTSTFIDFSQPDFRDGVAHAIYGGVFGKLNGNIDERAVKRTSPDVLHPFVQLGAAAPSGLCRDAGSDEEARNNDVLYASLFNKHKITKHKLKPKGATFAAETTDLFATEDTDFHPTDVLQDPDGSLLVVDTGGWYKLCCPTSQLWKPDVLGCIYRIRRVIPGQSPGRRMSGPDFPVGIAIARKGKMDNWQARLSATQGEPFAVHAITEALVREGKPAELRAALKTGSAPAQRAALVALAERDGADLKPEEVTPLLSSIDSETRRYALWILRRRPEWGPSVAAWAKSQFAEWATAGKLDLVTPVLSLFSRDAAGQDLIAECAEGRDFPLSLRQAAFEAMQGANLKEPPSRWSAATARALGEEDLTSKAASDDALRSMVLAALKTAGQLKENPGQPGVQSALHRIAAHNQAPADIRMQALANRAGGTPLSDSEYELLRSHLSPQTAPGLRFSSVRALTRGGLSADQKSGVADSLREVGPLEMNPLLAIFENGEDPQLGDRVLKALREAKARSSIRPDTLKACLAKLPADARKAGGELLAMIAPDNAEQARRVDSLLAEVKALKPDIRQGQSLFNSTKTACAQCHRIGYAGGDVGPSLTSIGEVRSERDLLEAVVYPSASFVRSYEPSMVITRDGESHNGIVRGETESELTLVTGPGAEQKIARAEILEQRPGAVSLMPSGLDAQLTRQELADLVAFLKNTHWGAR
ncbi:MAG: c-type cytochrome [Verrucomicrobia bacterium]|nr:c-type cytochrome [Verrucomicrobiota bacterium]MBI3870263.1 c-type cytochrome [Verrucomicrobiota bacterium]